MGLVPSYTQDKPCKHKIQHTSTGWMCVKCRKLFYPYEIEQLATIGASAERMCKQCEEADQEVKGR